MPGSPSSELRQDRLTAARAHPALHHAEQGEPGDGRGEQHPAPGWPAERLTEDQRQHEREHGGREHREARQVERADPVEAALRAAAGPAASTSSPTGTLTRKTGRHELPNRSALTSRPPSTWPSTAPPEITVAYRLIARARGPGAV